MKNFYAVVPDGRTEPVALFVALEDAIEWGMDKFGGDKFSIRGFAAEHDAADEAIVEPAPVDAAAGDVPIN